jgi:hypothetical protein
MCSSSRAKAYMRSIAFNNVMRTLSVRFDAARPVAAGSTATNISKIQNES